MIAKVCGRLYEPLLLAPSYLLIITILQGGYLPISILKMRKEPGLTLSDWAKVIQIEVLELGIKLMPT